jgi:hypothetical protein
MAQAAPAQRRGRFCTWRALGNSADCTDQNRPTPRFDRHARPRSLSLGGGPMADRWRTDSGPICAPGRDRACEEFAVTSGRCKRAARSADRCGPIFRCFALFFLRFVRGWMPQAVRIDTRPAPGRINRAATDACRSGRGRRLGFTISNSTAASAHSTDRLSNNNPPGNRFVGACGTARRKNHGGTARPYRPQPNCYGESGLLPRILRLARSGRIAAIRPRRAAQDEGDFASAL